MKMSFGMRMMCMHSIFMHTTNGSKNAHFLMATAIAKYINSYRAYGYNKNKQQGCYFHQSFHIAKIQKIKLRKN